MSDPTYEEPIPDYSRVPGWITPIGIIAVVFGLLGALAALISWASKQFTASMMKMAPTVTGPSPAGSGSPASGSSPSGPAIDMSQMFGYLDDWGWWLTTAGIVGLVLASLLLLGGILLLSRRKLSRGILLTWSYAKCIWALVYGFFQVQMSSDQMKAQAEMMEAMTQGGGAAMPQMGNMMNVMAKVGVMLSVVWLLALPIFLLCWFYRAKTLKDMDAWMK